MRTSPPSNSSSKTSPRVGGQLQNFISDHLVAGVGRSGSVAVIARSTASPVIEALSRHAPALAGTCSSLRIVVAEFCRKDAAALLHTFTGISGTGSAGAEIRHACRPRLIDAHEQLVFGDRWCWYGDSMRRDPRKRDAFESFANGNTELTRLAWLSFNRFWQTADIVAIGDVDRAAVRVSSDPARTTIELPNREPLQRQ
ncbi:MAG TPA: hypothetical protein PK264_18675 [Hyphomicrobiaceae bacterium]|nr:hypothetical protein [Hyphomicrobiaceae bacterium]